MSEQEPQLEHEVEVVTGEHVKSYLDEPTIRELMTNLRTHTYDKPKIAGQGIRMKMRQVLEPLGDILEIKLPPTLFKHAVETPIQKLHPAPSVKREVDEGVRDFKEAIDNGSAILLLCDGEPAGVCMVRSPYPYKLNDGNDGVELSEIAMVSVHPRFQGRGLLQKLYAEAQQKIETETPDHRTMSITKNPVMKKFLGKREWKEWNIDDMNRGTTRLRSLHEKGLSDKKIARWDEVWSTEGYVMMLKPQDGNRLDRD